MMLFISLLALLNVAAAFQIAVRSSYGRSMTMMAEKSKSLPFLPQPPNLAGLAGDVGIALLYFMAFSLFELKIL